MKQKYWRKSAWCPIALTRGFSPTYPSAKLGVNEADGALGTGASLFSNEHGYNNSLYSYPLLSLPLWLKISPSWVETEVYAGDWEQEQGWEFGKNAEMVVIFSVRYGQMETCPRASEDSKICSHSLHNCSQSQNSGLIHSRWELLFLWMELQATWRKASEQKSICMYVYKYIHARTNACTLTPTHTHSTHSHPFQNSNIYIYIYQYAVSFCLSSAVFFHSVFLLLLGFLSTMFSLPFWIIT